MRQGGSTRSTSSPARAKPAGGPASVDATSIMSTQQDGRTTGAAPPSGGSTVRAELTGTLASGRGGAACASAPPNPKDFAFANAAADAVTALPPPVVKPIARSFPPSLWPPAQLAKAAREPHTPLSTTSRGRPSSLARPLCRPVWLVCAAGADTDEARSAGTRARRPTWAYGVRCTAADGGDRRRRSAGRASPSWARGSRGPLISCAQARLDIFIIFFSSFPFFPSPRGGDTPRGCSTGRSHQLRRHWRITTLPPPSPPHTPTPHPHPHAQKLRRLLPRGALSSAHGPRAGGNFIRSR